MNMNEVINGLVSGLSWSAILGPCLVAAVAVAAPLAGFAAWWVPNTSQQLAKDRDKISP
jgi:hypothetical protein